MSEYCIHVANLFYLGSFLHRDILWLRILTCCGLLFGIVFFVCQTTPLYGPTFWHIVFLLINIVQIGRLIRARRESRLSDTQEQVAEDVFSHYSREQLVDLLTYSVSNTDDVLVGEQSIVLSPDDLILKRMAFEHLATDELVNLLTRRMWNKLDRIAPQDANQSILGSVVSP